jgi:hypothetical protein
MADNGRCGGRRHNSKGGQWPLQQRATWQDEVERLALWHHHHSDVVMQKQ